MTYYSPILSFFILSLNSTLDRIVYLEKTDLSLSLPTCLHTCLSTYLSERQTQQDGNKIEIDSVILWFTNPKATMTKAAPGESQKPGAFPGLLCGYAGLGTWAIFCSALANIQNGILHYKPQQRPLYIAGYNVWCMLRCCL